MEENNIWRMQYSDGSSINKFLFALIVIVASAIGGVIGWAWSELKSWNHRRRNPGLYPSKKTKK